MATFVQGMLVTEDAIGSSLAEQNKRATRQAATMGRKLVTTERTRELGSSTCCRFEARCCHYTSLVTGATAGQSLAAMATT